SLQELVMSYTRGLAGESTHPRVAPACGLLCVSIFLRSRTIWTSRCGRTALRAGGTRDAGAAGLHYADAERHSLARKTASVLLQGDDRVRSFWCAGLGCAGAVRHRCESHGPGRVSVFEETASWSSSGRRSDDGIGCRRDWIRPFGFH